MNTEGKTDFQIQLQDLLTRQEKRVAKLVAKGLAEKQIADELCVANGTVHKHTQNIRRKLGVASAVGIAVKYLQSLSVDEFKKFSLAIVFLAIQCFSMVVNQDGQLRMFRARRSSRRVEQTMYA